MMDDDKTLYSIMLLMSELVDFIYKSAVLQFVLSIVVMGVRSLRLEELQAAHAVDIFLFETIRWIALHSNTNARRTD